MKLLTPLALLLVLTSVADETGDRAAIVKLIASLNDGKPHPELQCHLTPAGAMSETSPPLVSTSAIQFITPDVALVDAVNTQYGSVVMVRRLPIVFVVKRDGTEWKIAATRLPANCRPPRKR
jgi:hypothetical protein